MPPIEAYGDDEFAAETSEEPMRETRHAPEPRAATSDRAAARSAPSRTAAVPSAATAPVALGTVTRVARLTSVPDEFLRIPRAPGARATDEPPPSRTLADIEAAIGDCRRCRLHEGRTKIVFGSGSPEAELLFVGEGPGREEDLQGLPFVGRAGQLLTEIIKAIGMTREQVYIANVVKCRPPENRTPEPDEAQACSGFLYRQIAVLRPKVVVALGKPATERLLRSPVSISAVRGRVFDLFGAKLVPTFHPAYLLRSPAKKREVWEDMKKVRDLLQGKPVEG